jgi:hypothetical protein
LVVTKFIEAMVLLHVQGPKNNTESGDGYLRADAPFRGGNNYFDQEFELKR